MLASIIASIVLRARFIGTPITSDEGGYLAVARAWASGQRLYTDAWVDRPQGLLVVYRLWDALTGGSPAAIRVMAMLFGCAAVVGVAYTVFSIAGPRAAAAASMLVAVASANARIEGFIANGELLAGGVAALGVAAACAYLFRGRAMSWLFVSGVLAGCAMSLKQSGFDGFLAVMLCLVVGGFSGERTWRQALHECLVCAAGVGIVMVTLLLHGVFVGFGHWWYAIAGYRLGGINTTSHADWHRFHLTALIAAPTVVPLAAVSVAGLLMWLAVSRRITRATVLLPAWLVFAALAFLTGGLFHRHYWVTLTFPLGAAAAVALAKINGRLLVAVTLLVTIPSLISTERVVVLDRDAAAVLASNDPRLTINEHVGDWYIEHRTPGSTLYAMCASAALYVNADTIPHYPYLWLDGALHGKDARAQLIALFAGDHPPTFVAIFDDARACDSSGQVDKILQEQYTRRATIDGVAVLMRSDGDPPAPVNRS